MDAPNEYVIDDSEYEFDITVKNTQVAKTVVNKRARAALRIIKLDEESKLPIEGVTFEIFDENKNLVGTLNTNKDGIAEIKDLVLGKYYYKEVSAPDKYIVNNKLKSFKLEQNEEIFETTVYNTPKHLPVTGGSLSLDMLIVLIVTGVTIAGFTVMKVMRSRKENN